jgi:hypothetical protein
MGPEVRDREARAESGDRCVPVPRCAPALRLEQVYGAIAYYLAHDQEIDAYLTEAEAQGAEINARARAARPELFERPERARLDRKTARR